MYANYYLTEKMAASINTARRDDANAYRLWKKATQSLHRSGRASR